jgi:hypothetical protein
MLTIKNAEVVGLDHAIRGMRNPKNSWERSDSREAIEDDEQPYYAEEINADNSISYTPLPFVVGENDHTLMTNLSFGGPVHRKYMRMIVVYLDICAPLYWWKEFDTCKVGTVANSCSTMHKLTDKEFEISDFSCEHLVGMSDYNDESSVPYLDFSPLRDKSAIYSPHGILECCIIPMLNLCREHYLKCDEVLKSNDNYGLHPEETREKIREKQKQYWWQMIQLLPSSYNQRRTIMLNYEVLANIYASRKNHKLDEWRRFCAWIDLLPYSEIITGEKED